jgi:hypothetical protein
MLLCKFSVVQYTISEKKAQIIDSGSALIYNEE